MLSRWQKGVDGEKQALKYLKKKGMKLVADRYRVRGGEIDLIMTDKDTLVFVEVKYRPDGETGSGFLAVDVQKQRRITLAAQYYLAEKEYDGLTRFDVVEITGKGIQHLENAFPAVF